mmetsp:Transcript_15721/g.31626  ORF Transcript_15721/g.31626 Transcript_15721/m.31626 type:complete len:101 (-) Transcript_15721:1371-1673(-)
MIYVAAENVHDDHAARFELRLSMHHHSLSRHELPLSVLQTYSLLYVATYMAAKDMYTDASRQLEPVATVRWLKMSPGLTPGVVSAMEVSVSSDRGCTSGM